VLEELSVNLEAARRRVVVAVRAVFLAIIASIDDDAWS
jgi:hypothetical protein